MIDFRNLPSYCQKYKMRQRNKFKFIDIYFKSSQLKHGFAGLGNTTESGQIFTTENISKLLISIKSTTDS